MKNKFLFGLIIILGLTIIYPLNLKAEEQSNPVETVNLYLFYSKTCPHCHEEAKYLVKLQSEYGEKLKINSFELSENEANLELLLKFGERFNLNLSQTPVPVTFIGSQSMIGYGSDEFDGAKIKNMLEQCFKLGCQDLGQEVMTSPPSEKKSNNVWIGVIIGFLVVFGVIIFLINRKKE